MELQRSQEPGAHVHHDPAELSFPSVPSHDLKTGSHAADITLPDLRTVLSPQFEHARPAEVVGSPGSVRSLPPIDPGHSAGYASGSIDATMVSPSEAGSRRSEDERGRRGTSVVSMEDPDVRLAAEALSGLGNPGMRDQAENALRLMASTSDTPKEFVRSPTSANSHDLTQHEKAVLAHARETGQDPEPILQLFASKHPWVGGTINGSINGSMYVYNTTKHYSPRFVQYGANLLERNIATPMVNTVGSVGRFTGVEGGLRRYLDDGRPSRPKDIEHGNADAMEIDTEHPRRDSTEVLPPYRPSKPPSYREEYSPAANDRVQQRPPHNRSWSSQVAGQVFVMTSGLGVALSVTSRRSLQFCLQTLGQATVHIATVTEALKMVLEQYDQARDSWHQHNDSSLEKGGDRPRTPDHDEAARRLADIIKRHSDDIWKTLKDVTNYVSNSAGGALPDNARHFVTAQLMSLPQRWRVVSANSTGESETSRSAHRMIAFATEGLDMINQVSHVMKATLESAEQWLERAGRGETGKYQQQAYLAEKQRQPSDGSHSRQYT